MYFCTTGCASSSLASILTASSRALRPSSLSNNCCTGPRSYAPADPPSLRTSPSSSFWTHAAAASCSRAKRTWWSSAERGSLERSHRRAVHVLLIQRRALLKQPLHHRVEQQLHHLRLAPKARQHQRGPAALVLLVERRALVEQQLHHLRAALGARLHQRGPAPLVILVERCALVEQQLHHLRVALDARPHQRGAAPPVLLVDRRALVEQLLHQLRVAALARLHQQGLAVLVLLIGRRALLKQPVQHRVEQQLRHLRVAVLARIYQRGNAVLVLLVDRRAIVEQLLHQHRVAGPARCLKWAHRAFEGMRWASVPSRDAPLPVSVDLLPSRRSRCRCQLDRESACHRGGNAGQRQREKLKL
eukprot:scaffold3238_cov60-Phaeocystis_antarctica.AAC.6